MATPNNVLDYPSINLSDLVPHPELMNLKGADEVSVGENIEYETAYSHGMQAAAYLLGMEIYDSNQSTGRLIAENARLRYEANHDELTGLPNRRFIMRTLESLIEKGDEGVALMYIDLDDLKRANSEGGHTGGDRLILGTARAIIGQSLRTEDTEEQPVRPHDIEGSDAARVGGDEFIILLRGIMNGRDLEIVANRVIDNLEAAGINASVGAARHEAGQTASELVDLADQAMDLDKTERRPQRQARELAALPKQEVEDMAAIMSFAAARGVSLAKLLRYHGATSR